MEFDIKLTIGENDLWIGLDGIVGTFELDYYEGDGYFELYSPEGHNGDTFYSFVIQEEDLNDPHTIHQTISAVEDYGDLSQVTFSVDNKTPRSYSGEASWYDDGSRYYLFAHGDHQASICTLHYFKIYENNVLIRDFIPARRNSDNVLGMYDQVNNVFYINAGTGTFVTP